MRLRWEKYVLIHYANDVSSCGLVSGELAPVDVAGSFQGLSLIPPVSNKLVQCSPWS